MIDADDLDTDSAGKNTPRPFDRLSSAGTFLYSIGLGAVGVAIIVIGIIGAFRH